MRKFAREQWSQGALYNWLVLLSAIASVLGILWGAITCKAIYGERGGAITVAFAFWILIAKRDYGARLQKALQTPLPSLSEESVTRKDRDDLAVLRRDIDAIDARLRVEASGQKHQDGVLAFVSVFGTIVWGFGDVLVKLLERPMYQLLHYFAQSWISCSN
jgi:hypothetical protein